MPAVDDAPPVPRRLLLELVEVHPRRVLVQPRRHLVLRLFERHALRMRQPLSRRVILPERRAARRRRVERRDAREVDVVERGLRGHVGRIVGMGRRAGVALVDHDPPVELEHALVALVEPDGPHPDDARVALRRLAPAERLRLGAQRVAREHRPQEAQVGVAEVARRVERDLADRAAEDDVEDEQVVHGRALEAEAARELVGAAQRLAVARQRDVQRNVAVRDRARHRVDQPLPRAQVLKEVAAEFHRGCYIGRTLYAHAGS